MKHISYEVAVDFGSGWGKGWVRLARYQGTLFKRVHIILDRNHSAQLLFSRGSPYSRANNTNGPGLDINVCMRPFCVRWDEEEFASLRVAARSMVDSGKYFGCGSPKCREIFGTYITK